MEDKANLYWQTMSRRVREQRSGRIQPHVFLGDHWVHRFPLLVPMAALWRHLFCFGGSGDGKTVLLTQIASQIMRLGEASVVVLDLKPSLFVLNVLLAIAASLIHPITKEPIYKVRILNPSMRAFSHIFNPLAQSLWRKMTPQQRAEFFLDVFDIRIIEGSKEAYFAAISELVLLSYLDWHRLIETFEQLAHLMDDREVFKGMNGNINDWQHARHPIVFLKRLASYYALKAIPTSADQGIDIEDIVIGEKPTPLICHLASLEDPRIALCCSRMVWKLLLFALAVLRTNPNKRKVAIIGDECQNLYGPAFVQAIEIAHEFGATFMSFNQSRAQLITPAGDFRDTVDACAGAQIMMSLRNNEDFEYVMATAPEQIYHQLKWSQLRRPGDSLNGQMFHPNRATVYGFSDEQSIEISEQLRPYPDKNLLMKVSSDDQGGLFRLHRNEGMWAFNGAWTPFRWSRHVSQETYQQFSETEPDALPGMVLNTTDAEAPQASFKSSLLSSITAPASADSVASASSPLALAMMRFAFCHWQGHQRPAWVGLLRGGLPHDF